jgi:hypothetical protein
MYSKTANRMPFRLVPTAEASAQIAELERLDLKKFRKVQKAILLLSSNPRHPGLNSHKYTALKGRNGQDVWESCVENNTSSAWRIFWHYGPDPGAIAIIAVRAYPK